MKVMEHATHRTASLCIEGYRQVTDTSTANTMANTMANTRRAPENKVSGTVYPTILGDAGYRDHNHTKTACRVLSRAEHCLTIMAHTSEVSIRENLALTITREIRNLMAVLLSSDQKSVSQVFEWVNQDIKILIDHFTDRELLGYLGKAEEIMQGRDINMVQKIKKEEQLTGKLILLVKRVQQNYKISGLDKPDKGFKLKPRNPPTFNNCFVKLEPIIYAC